MPFMTMMLPIWTGSWMPKPYRRRKNHSVTSRMPRATTVKPMTEPAEKATRNPRLRPSEAAWAVRELAWVAIFMPMNPARRDQTPPVRKAKGVNLESMSPPDAKAMTINITNTAAKTGRTVLYCRCR